MVFLKNDSAYPLIVAKYASADKIICQWFDKSGHIHKSPFSADMLMSAEHCRTPDHNSYEVYGLTEYQSLFGSAVSREAAEHKMSRKLYNFKKHGKDSEFFRDAILKAQTLFLCEKIIVVPGHTPEPNELQKLFGSLIVREKETEERKYSHYVPLPNGYAESYRIMFDAIPQRSRCLLVDDIVTSGATLLHFANILRLYGADVILFAMGISHGLHPKTHFCLGDTIIYKSLLLEK